MKNTRFSALFLAGVLMLLPALFSGCGEIKEPAPPSSSSSIAEPSENPPEEPSSQPESEVTASQEPEPTEEPTQMADFEEVFAENPIDTKLADDLSAASSSKAIFKAYETAGKYWKEMIPLAYNAAKEVVGEEDRAQLEQDQQTWKDTIDDIVSAIQEENEDSSDGKITSARLIEERYRETAKSLCEIIFAETGELPDFSPAMSDTPKG